MISKISALERLSPLNISAFLAFQMLQSVLCQIIIHTSLSFVLTKFAKSTNVSITLALNSMSTPSQLKTLIQTLYANLQSKKRCTTFSDSEELQHLHTIDPSPDNKFLLFRFVKVGSLSRTTLQTNTLILRGIHLHQTNLVHSLTWTYSFAVLISNNLIVSCFG